MRIKLDENMPASLMALLQSAGHDAATVVEEKLSGEVDSVVIRAAASEGRLLITFDRDFLDIREYPPGSHAGIVVFRLEDQRWPVLEAAARRVIDSGILDRLRQGLAIVDDARIRIRPGNGKDFE